MEPPQGNARARGRRRGTGQVRARLQVAPDAPLGPREIRIATPQGVSSVGLVVVVDEPVAAEQDDRANDRPETAQKLTLPGVVAGRIGKLEDVDWYAFEAEKGEWVNFEVWGNRLENKIHDLQAHFDPILTLHDARGRKVAVADNSYAADPLLSFRAPATGTYYLEIRDTTYSGNVSWCYALHAMKGPVATSVFPMAVNPGAETRVEVRGPGFDPARMIALSVRKDLTAGKHLFSLVRAGGGSRPIPFVVMDHPVVMESTDAPEGAGPMKPLKLPAAIAGRLDARGDIDGYAFAARKGQTYAFEVIASRAGSECDPVLKLIDSQGKTVVEADDVRGLGKDARIEWTATDGRRLPAPGRRPSRPGRPDLRLRAPGRGGQTGLRPDLRPGQDQRGPWRSGSRLRPADAPARLQRCCDLGLGGLTRRHHGQPVSRSPPR